MPVPVGAVFTTSHLLVTDTFGMTLSLAPAAHAQTGGGRAEGAGRWTTFLPSLADGTAVAHAFVLPASAVQRLTSRPVEDVHLLRDEAANLAWAVEAVVEGAANRVADPAWAGGVQPIPFLGPRVRDREIAESDGVSHRLTWVSLIAAASMVSSDSSTSSAASPRG